MLTQFRTFVAFVALATIVVDVGVRAQTAGEDVATAPVVVDGRVLFSVRGMTSYPAESRAAAIHQRLVAVAEDPDISPDALEVSARNGALQLTAGQRPIMIIVEADAVLEQLGLPELAAAHRLRLRQAIVDYREARSARALRQDAVNSLIATGLLGVALVIWVWMWRGIDAFLTRRLRARIHSVEIQSFELMRAERIWSVTRSVLLTVRALGVMVLVLLHVGFVLAQFPWTRGLSANMVDFAFGPLRVIGGGIVAHIPSLVFLAVLFVVVRIVLRTTRLFFEALDNGAVRLANFDPEWAMPTYKIVRLAVMAFALIVAYPYIPGSESAAFKGVSIFMGIVFSLGSSTAIANIMAGYMMTYRRAFKIGDRVRMGAVVGDVIETRLQVTRLRSTKNEEVIIPNSQILSNEVLNYSSLARLEGLILHTEVGIGYETPWRQVEAMLLMAAERTPGLTMEPPPFVLEKKLGDFAVTYELNVYCHDVPKMNRLYAGLHRNILDVFNEYGVQIMTPAYEGDPNAPKVVAHKDWYLAPADNPARPASSVRDAAGLA